MQKHLLFIVAPALVLALLTAGRSNAIRIEFADYELEASGAGSRTRMYLTNNGATPAAVQIDVATRTQDIDGVETNQSASDRFTVLPRQLLLPPNSEKMVSIAWKGPSKVEVEQAYRLIVRELPIDLDPPAAVDPDTSTSRVKVITRIRKSLYVSPAKKRAAIGLVSAQPVEGADGENALELVLENSGSGHEIISRLDLSITPMSKDGKQFAAPITLGLTGPELGGRFNLLAKSRRRLAIPWPEGLRVGPVDVTLE